MAQLLRLVIVGALMAAVVALPSIGRFLRRRRLAHLFTGLMATAMVFVAAQYGQRATTSPSWAVAAIRLQMTAVLLWVPLCLGLLAEATRHRVPRWIFAVTTGLATTPWLGELLVADRTYLRARGDGEAILAATSGPMFPVVALYGLGALAWIGARLWQHDRPGDPTVRRFVLLALGALLASVVNDVLLVVGAVATVSVMDLGIALGALLLVSSLQAMAASKQVALEHVSAEAVEDLRHAQRELEAALENTLHLINALPDTILLHHEGRLAFINPAGRQWLGLEDDALGTPVEELLVGMAATGSPLLDPAPPSEPFQERFRGREGATLYGEVRALPLVHEGLPMQMAIIRDLSHRREMEQRLLTADRLSSLGTLAAGVGHEINNPLTYISSNLALAREEAESGDVRAMLDDAYEGVRRVARIVESLSTFARRRRSTDTDIDVGRAVDTALKLVGHQVRHQARIEVDVAADLPRVAGSEDDLIQVLVNLLINASHAIEEAPGRAHRIAVSVRVEEEELRITVDDTGCGISKEHEKRLLEPFFTTKPVGKGTGLGLSICHGIVQGMAGELSLEGRDVGARALIRLPAQTRASEQSSERSSEPSAPVVRAGAERTMRILVVDDDPMVRRSLRRALSGHEVVLEESGEAGLAACRDQFFDLVLCDVMMPGISGTEFLTTLSKDEPEQAARVVLVTGGVFTPEERTRLRGLGARVLQKPVTPEQLQETLGRYSTPSS